ncbi:Protein of unknown function [Pseudomonas cedrina]|uniref:DUF1120 domain-containing protein n=2 Tax=Pseudomonas cedrina TaxID=651740 RepID=A0A1V2KED8_PSECE|nr:DUF1120 domain-containing protein [Pseudomonas cedrina]ONH55211.1 hypothetical protein BLL36_09930 [Pseudomonas cedrina subsp. cedrina]SDR89860.1 Protein of unknown function [Pseudomonas cedrina]
MNTALKTLMSALMLTSAGTAMAASSVDLSVRGLITPSACEPTLSSGGVYDIGKISAKDLNADDFTNLGEHILQLTVTCDAATLMAIEPKDNRAGSSSDDANTRFGLGLINGTEKLGFLEMWLSSMLADGIEGRPIGSADGGLTWARKPSLAHDTITSVADTTTLAPLPVQLLTADLSLSASIAPANSLTLTNEVAIDGSVTLTVKYL